jgi:hypothetical protein
MRSIPAFSFALVLLSTGSSFAQDDKTEANPSLSVTVDNSVGFNSETETLFSEHEFDLVLEAARGDVSFSAEFWLYLYGDLTLAEMYPDFPGAEFIVSAPGFGEVQFWDAGTALAEACVTPADGSANVGNEDLMAVGTCAGFSAGQSIVYISPEMGGFKVYVSGMMDARGVIESGEVDSGVSAAVSFEHAVGDATLSASLGVDHATSIKVGLPPGNNLPTTVQAGAALEWETWRFGAAGQVDVISFDGTPVWAAGIGVGKTFADQLTVTGELATDHYDDTGDPITEVSVGATAELTVIEDALTVDAGANVLRRTSPGGVDDTVFQVETGFEVSF